MAEDGIPGGTRFRLFRQTPGSGGPETPDTVTVGPRPGQIGAGPCDDRMYVVDALGHKPPYDDGSGPPWRGPCRPPTRPGPDGHFDHIPVDHPDFPAVHMYGSVRLALDVWERYLGETVRWPRFPSGPRLELIPVVDWDNAHFGPGYIEAGFKIAGDGARSPFCLNFDVLAHETAHAILFSVMGYPEESRVTAEYLGFQEAAADLMSLLSFLHFSGAIDQVLNECGGNLYVLNALSRIGEFAAADQIRVASNDSALADLVGVRYLGHGDWFDPKGLDRDAHDMSLPLTGAVFDILVELFQDGLVARGLIEPDNDARGWRRDEVELAIDRLGDHYGSRLERFRDGFRHALTDARDLVGACLAEAVRTLRPDDLSYDGFAARYLTAALDRGQRGNLEAILIHFGARGIDPLAVPAPPLRPPLSPSYAERHAAAMRQSRPRAATPAILASLKALGHRWR
ncbi:hypothetical protein [Skermanella stibiiresistens]|nr:hypothetical protein [Skermanella stibiiresistens]